MAGTWTEVFAVSPSLGGQLINHPKDAVYNTGEEDDSGLELDRRVRVRA